MSLQNNLNVSEKLIEYTRGLIGEHAWSPEIGVGSNLTIEFGRRLPAVDGHVHGEWHLWVTMGAWRIEDADSVIAASEDARPVMERAVAGFAGRQVQGVVIDFPGLETRFVFNGLMLCVFPVCTRQDVPDPFEHWMLWRPAGDIVVSGPGSSVSLERQERKF